MDKKEIKNLDKFEFALENMQIEESGWKEENGNLQASIHFQSETVTNGGFKPWDEIQKTAELWDKAYLTFDHPGDNDRYEDFRRLLRDPRDVIGRIGNAELDEENRRLNSIAKIPLERPSFSKHSDEEWNKMLEEVKQRDEISIGYFFEPEKGVGTFERNGEKMEYEFQRTNILPDHIAILEDSPACTRDQGCGIGLENIRYHYEFDDISDELDELIRDEDKNKLMTFLNKIYNKLKGDEKMSKDEKPLDGEETTCAHEDQIQDLKADLRRLTEENAELKTTIEKYREQERERLEASVKERTDLSGDEISEMETDDLKLILKGSERAKIPSTEGSGNDEKSGKNLNSEPGIKGDRVEPRTVPDMYWKHKKKE